jgi:hypothetical protein
VRQHHIRRNAQPDRPFDRTIIHAAVAVHTEFGMGNYRDFIILRAEKDILGTDISAGTAPDTLLFINYGGHQYLLYSGGQKR